MTTRIIASNILGDFSFRSKLFDQVHNYLTRFALLLKKETKNETCSFIKDKKPIFC